MDNFYIFIYLLAGLTGGLALVVQQISEVRDSEQVSVNAIWLDKLTAAQVQSLLVGSPDTSNEQSWAGTYTSWCKRPNNEFLKLTWFNVLNSITHQLWDLAMEPIVRLLQSLGKSEAILIPVGLLGLLPLHAAWTEDPNTLTGLYYALDAVNFTYVPNARSIAYARQVAEQTAPTSFLAIDEPQPVQAGGLPNAQREIETALAALPNHQVLRHEQATRSAVLETLPQHSILHFSCHGYANFNEPLESGLVMAHDEILSLRDLLDL